jgi:hypothetical protein
VQSEIVKLSWVMFNILAVEYKSIVVKEYARKKVEAKRVSRHT